ncbi:HEAT repeat domain-containing protein, partial [Candidatus Binatia bacterium]|nr:HEAT repeat domain-containing protein [Candidatus Binatia bacterium]
MTRTPRPDRDDLGARLGAAEDRVRADARALLADRLRDRGAAAIDEPIARALLVPLGSASRTEQRHTADLVAPFVEQAETLRAVLREALAAPGARLRWGAAYTLGRALPPGRDLWPAALETMRLDDGDQRWAAAELACRIARREPAVRDDILRALGDPSATLRKMILYCLRDLQDTSLAERATDLLADADTGVRLAALAALAVVAPSETTAQDRGRAARTMVDLLRTDPDPGVRRAAAATLGKLRLA